MSLQLIEQHIQELANVTTATHYGYTFYFYDTDQMVPFVSIATTDNEGDTVSQLDREGIYRINIGITKDSFNNLFPEAGNSYDFAVLHQLMPHPHYAAQHFVCVLNPEADVLIATLGLIDEAYKLARSRFERKQARKANDPAGD